MFMRFLKPKAPAPQPVLPLPAIREDTLAYFMPEKARHAPRELSAIDQMYAYYSED